MSTTSRWSRLAVLVSSVVLSAVVATAQPAQDVSQPESFEMTALLIVFCAIVIGLLAYTARRMATLR